MAEAAWAEGVDPPIQPMLAFSRSAVMSSGTSSASQTTMSATTWISTRLLMGMRRGVAGRKLGVTSTHRLSMFRNMTVALIKQEQIAIQ